MFNVNSLSKSPSLLARVSPSTTVTMCESCLHFFRCLSCFSPSRPPHPSITSHLPFVVPVLVNPISFFIQSVRPGFRTFCDHEPFAPIRFFNMSLLPLTLSWSSGPRLFPTWSNRFPILAAGTFHLPFVYMLSPLSTHTFFSSRRNDPLCVFSCITDSDPIPRAQLFFLIVVIYSLPLPFPFVFLSGWLS